MEQINLDPTQITSQPTRRDEVYVPFKKFVLASDFSIPSYDPSTGANGSDRGMTSPARLYWVEKYNGDPNGYIGLGPGYITLNFSGMYLINCRVTLRPDTVGNSQRVVWMKLWLDSTFDTALNDYGAYSDGDVCQLTANGFPTSSVFKSESSPGAGDSGGTSLFTQMFAPVIPFTEIQAPRVISTFFYQQSDALQPQNLTPRDQDIWLQVAYMGVTDTTNDVQSRFYLDPPH